MEISKKKAPAITDVDMKRVVNQIYDDMNSLIDSVNHGKTTEEKNQYQGKPGDLRIVLDSGDKNYYMEAKTDEGWIRSDSSSTSGFSFKSKS